MTETNREVIRKNHCLLMDNLNPNDVIPYMVKEGVFNTDMQDRIQCAGTRQRQAEEFLHILESQGEAAFYIFLQALQGSYPHLCHILQNDHNGKANVE